MLKISTSIAREKNPCTKRSSFTTTQADLEFLKPLLSQEVIKEKSKQVHKFSFDRKVSVLKTTPGT